MTAIDVLTDLLRAEQAYRDALNLVQSQAAALFVAVRREHSLTQQQFAAVLAVDHSFVSKVENGHLRAGKPVLRRLAAWLAEKEPS